MTPVTETYSQSGNVHRATLRCWGMRPLREKKKVASTRGNATVARMMWLASSVLVGSLAIHRGDLVFILLQISSMTSAAVILFLAYRYRGMVCDYHAHLALHNARAL